MWYVYILKSKVCDKYYTGYTGNLQDRVKWHNLGKSRWSKRYMPWKLVYIEAFEDKTSAIKRERQLKSYKSKKHIEKLIGPRNGEEM
jgi:putative endonuclease